ncbi:unnamed protein product [Prunus armeniaca]|uniref:Uncharacterized protein n=1 Tax=Prunus armeniaca TaxID=36596 RepID=A0A6J5XTA7_PRUAR|nr:unnamed protein product [Prunus armeniaca]
MWMKEKGFEDVVKEAWEYNVDEHLSVKEKLKRTQLKECKEELALLQCVNPSEQQSQRKAFLERKIDDLLENKKLCGKKVQGWSG